LRGARFGRYSDGTQWPASGSEAIAHRALRDVAQWLGFRRVKKYLAVLVEEKAAIFARAKDDA
jgi:hypothetical protein